MQPRWTIISVTSSNNFSLTTKRVTFGKEHLPREAHANNIPLPSDERQLAAGITPHREITDRTSQVSLSITKYLHHEVASSRSMPTASKINSLRRKRNRHLDNILNVIKEGIYDYQQSNNHDVGLFKLYQPQLEEGWKRFVLVQEDLDDLDEEEYIQKCKALRTYLSLDSQ